MQIKSMFSTSEAGYLADSAFLDLQHGCFRFGTYWRPVRKGVQSRIEALLLYLPSFIGDSIDSFYVSESSKNLSNWTFG